MSERILKHLSQEVSLTTADTMGGAQLVRLRNADATGQYSIVVKASGTITGSITIHAGEVLYIRKKAAETIESSAVNTDVRAVVVGFGD